MRVQSGGKVTQVIMQNSSGTEALRTTWVMGALVAYAAPCKPCWLSQAKVLWTEYLKMSLKAGFVDSFFTSQKLTVVDRPLI